MAEKILVTPRSYGKDMPELFEQLRAAGCEVVRNTTGGILEKEQMKALLADCTGVIVGVDPLDAEVLACAPGLKAVAKYGVGVDTRITAGRTASACPAPQAQTAKPSRTMPWL